MISGLGYYIYRSKKGPGNREVKDVSLQIQNYKYDELREFGRQRLTETSKDLLNFLYHKYSIAQENAHKKFKDYKSYVTKNFPGPIGRQIFSHVYSFNSKLKKDLYKRRKKKIYFLIRNYKCNTSKNVHSQGPYNSRFKKIIYPPNLRNSINKINNTVHRKQYFFTFA